MSYCRECGAYIPDGENQCLACGWSENKKRSGAAAQARPKPGPEKERKKSASGGGTTGGYKRSYDYGGGQGSYSGGEDRRGAGRYYSSSEDRRGADRYYSGSEDRRGADRYYSSGERKSSKKDYAGEYNSDAQRNRGMASLCYLGPLFILPWLLRPNSQFVKYHVNQGLVLFLLWVIVGIFDFIPFMWVANLFAFVCVCMGLGNAWGGRRRPLPLIGEITLIK